MEKEGVRKQYLKKREKDTHSWDRARESDTTKIESALRIFFSQKGRKSNWRVFITTDTSLSYIKMIEIYQIRWTVEVFSKEVKKLLSLGRCQSNDFDSQVADTTNTMIQRILLTLKFRFEHFETKGALFSHIREVIIEARLNERLWGLFIELIRVLEVVFDDVDEMMSNHNWLKSCALKTSSKL